MALEYRQTPCGTYRTSLTACPVCGEEFQRPAGVSRQLHIAGHTPEDFGLSPLGEGRSA